MESPKEKHRGGFRRWSEFYWRSTEKCTAFFVMERVWSSGIFSKIKIYEINLKCIEQELLRNAFRNKSTSDWGSKRRSFCLCLLDFRRRHSTCFLNRVNCSFSLTTPRPFAYKLSLSLCVHKMAAAERERERMGKHAPKKSLPLSPLFRSLQNECALLLFLARLHWKKILLLTNCQWIEIR